MSSSVQARFDETMARADDVFRRKLEREEAQLEADAAADAAAARAQARADSERCREIGAIFDDAFRSFDVQTPQPVDGEGPGRYRRRLFGRLQRRLPDTSDLQGIRADELPAGQAYLNFERMVIDAAKAEGQRPSEANLPASGELVARNRVDSATGERSVEWFGKESFIRGMGREGRRVRAIVDRNSGQAIWGRLG